MVIAIDGFSSCGKSTLARQLADYLHYVYVDSGAMYRAVTLYFLQNDIDFKDEEAVERALSAIHIRFEWGEKGRRIFLNGTDVEDEIRQMRVSEQVSPVAAISAVRKAMVSQQQDMGKEKNIVMDGRDIGTVVFPDAALKIFLTAGIEERTRRRYVELKAKGYDLSMEEVRKNLQERDHIDSTRADSPLRKAEDAVVIDNTSLTESEQLAQAIRLVHETIGNTTT